MVKRFTVEGFDAFEKIISEQGNKTAFVLFSGSTDPATGKNFCSDCIKAHPVIESVISSVPEDAIFITCHVGVRDVWKDKNNVFRTNEKTKLKSVPTLIKWGTNKRLEEEDCAKQDLVEMLFEED